MNKKILRMLSKRLSQIRQRCGNKNCFDYQHFYGAFGIKNKLTIDDLIFLWERDGADKMERPTIDRIDPQGNYEIPNCRFLEMRENIGRKRLSIYPPAEKPCRLCGKIFIGIWKNKYCSGVCCRRYNNKWRKVDGELVYIRNLIKEVR